MEIVARDEICSCNNNGFSMLPAIVHTLLPYLVVSLLRVIVLLCTEKNPLSFDAIRANIYNYGRLMKTFKFPSFLHLKNLC